MTEQEAIMKQRLEGKTKECEFLCPKEEGKKTSNLYQVAIKLLAKEKSKKIKSKKRGGRE
jgi:hypothetical protein